MFGTARGRLGYAWDRFMLYGTGGFAWAENDATVTGPGIAVSQSQTHTGWAAGAGIEWAFADRWSAKVEYMHLDLGSETYASNILGGVSVDTQLDTVKFGVNYRFGP
jgi:outer membrane immunogenic protein